MTREHIPCFRRWLDDPGGDSSHCLIAVKEGESRSLEHSRHPTASEVNAKGAMSKEQTSQSMALLIWAAKNRATVLQLEMCVLQVQLDSGRCICQLTTRMGGVGSMKGGIEASVVKTVIAGSRRVFVFGEKRCFNVGHGCAAQHTDGCQK